MGSRTDPDAQNSQPLAGRGPAALGGMVLQPHVEEEGRRARSRAGRGGVWSAADGGQAGARGRGRVPEPFPLDPGAHSRGETAPECAPLCLRRG